MNKKRSAILAIIIFIIINLPTVIYANNTNIRLSEKTEVYKKWESLSPKERENTIQPIPYGIGIKQSLKRSRYNTLLGGNTSLESRFDLTEEYNIIVKNQKKTMSCWAFSATTMLESNVAMRNALLGKEYSPLHMEYRATEMYNKPKLAFGNASMALAYMTNGYGPVNESDFPMEDVYNETKNSGSTFYLSDPDVVNVNLDKMTQLKVLDTTIFANIYKKYDSTTGETIYHDAYGEQYTLNQVDVVRKKIKQHIIEYGAVTAMIYSDVDGGITSDGQYISKYHDQTTDVYGYKVDYTDAESANHQITIVGWDDTKKAYIVQNSWGEIFENNGCFYVSYDDVWIESEIRGVNNVEELTGNNIYDKVYQYDELGMNYTIGFNLPIYYANVFTRENKMSGKDEYVTEVGLYIGETTGIEVYVNSKDGKFKDSQGNTKLKLVHTGEILEPGYHVIKLNATEDTKLTGDKFIVAIKSTNDLGGAVPIEMNLYDSGSTIYSTIYDTATGEKGQSFLALNLTDWEDLNGFQISYIETLKNSNVCIKAFTKYVEQPNEIPVTGVSLNKESIVITEGETETLVATVLPENSTNPSVTWTSSNNNIATVSGDGVITAVSAGEVTITVTTEDGGYTATCNVKVEPKVISVTSVLMTPSEGTLKVGNTLKLSATVVPSNATNKTLIWESTDNTIATVSGGIVTAHKPGNATIKAISEDGGFQGICKITVIPNTISVEKVTLNEATKTIEIGETLALHETVEPSNATNKNVTWETSNGEVATVSESGIVTGIKPGTVTITVTTVDGNKKATCQVTVKAKTAPVISVTEVTLNESAKTIKVGETFTIIQTVLPENATNKNVTWKSSNEEVATVIGGIVTAIGEGETLITVTTIDGNKTATCKVIVEKNVINVERVSLNKNNEIIKEGETLALNATVLPENATNKNVTWETSNAEIATVDNNGIVTGLKAGTAVIAVKTVDGSKTATCTITVEKDIINVKSVELDKGTEELEVGEIIILKQTVLPENATNKNVTWETSNSEIATVENGKVIALKPGTVTIIVKTVDGNKTAECTIVVKETESEPEDKEVKVESIELEQKEITLQVSDKTTLIVKFNPELPSNTKVKWESSNEKVAIVDENGIVKAVGVGKATITVTSNDGGFTSQCKVKVTKQVEDPDDIYKDPDDDVPTVEEKPDNSIADKELPQTGLKITYFAITAVLVVMVYSFIKYRKLRDVK